MKKRTTKKRVPISEPPKQPEPHMSTISNCTFTGVHWDKATLDIIRDVTKALLNLSELFRSQNVQIDSLLKLGGGSLGVSETTMDRGDL
jgi:hypothetical protein